MFIGHFIGQRESAKQNISSASTVNRDFYADAFSILSKKADVPPIVHRPICPRRVILVVLQGCSVIS